ncbi:hypothetical protein [Chryseobacterium flavum]|uniref:hypothetical protein n=1 Tax=Chryseobacterium flavum TaxID=415851 RepID=UPI0028AB1B33|nr:hypothetical protein [Chryseobacterium flavum]
MKILILLCLISSSAAFSQSSEELMRMASADLKAKDYCSASANFKKAFEEKTEAGIYEYTSAALAAAHCNDLQRAVGWLKKSYDLGFGKSREEINLLKTDPGFKALSQNNEFQSLLAGMEDRLARKEEFKKKEAELWNKDIISNQIKEKTPFNEAHPGFALYFTDVNGLKVPYIVFVPKGYKVSKQTKAIVYLHGGVNSLSDFYYRNADVKTEPIFSVGENFNSIVIYPFAKKDFGWVDQKMAFENIFTIIQDVEKKYNIDKTRIYLGGMSNGGTAAFWFASQQETPFRAFYAFAPNPVLNIGEIRFENITKEHPLYSISSKDDLVFSYDTVLSIYNKNKIKAKGWKFQTIETGTHGFIYNPEINKELLSRFFSEVLK